MLNRTSVLAQMFSHVLEQKIVLSELPVFEEGFGEELKTWTDILVVTQVF